MLDLSNPNVRGYEIWASDGTPAGTISMYSSTTKIDYVKSAVVYNNEVYFVAQDPSAYENYLFKTNGTQVGTTKLLSSKLLPYLDFKSIIVSGSYLFLAAERSSPNNIGVEIWKTDGTAAGTTVYQTITGADYLFYKQLYSTQSKIFFIGDEPSTGDELYLFTGNVTSNFEPSKSSNFSCYPNPCVDILNIDYKGAEPITAIRLRNINGKLILESNAIESLPTNELAPGLYIVELETPNHIEVLKIQKR